ncbi:MAG: ABC transporter permease [Candidatus Melainabacteria bacterium]|jgi:ABC-type Na+ efflux pump permease subunit|nr:ABC transporter permease [Candidatus Melainabacteria bacterium]
MGHEIATLMRKEIVETIREFKSLGLFIVFCAIFFPMFSLFGNTEISAALIEDSLTNQKGTVGVRGDIELVRQVLTSKKELEVKPLFDLDPVKSIEERIYDVVVVMPETNSDHKQKSEEESIDVFYDSHAEGTIAWALEVAAALNSSQIQMLKSKLRQIGVATAPEALPKVDYKSIDIVERKGSAPLSETLPTVILFFITTVAIGGAIGGITMERENKRLAQLLLLPIKRSSILYSLLFVISGISLLPVMAGLFSLSWAFSLDEVADRLKMHNLVVDVPPETVAALLLLSVPIAISVTATSLLFSSYYRVAQQARGYSLIYMVALNGLIRYILNFHALDGVVAFIPIVNSVFVMQRMLDGKVDALQIIIATISTLAVSAWMIEISARKLDDQRLLFGIERAPKFQPRWGKTSQSKT